MNVRSILTAALLAAVPSSLHADGVAISEILAVNQTEIADEDGDRSDWIELANTSDVDVNLDGWHLSDDPDELAKWRLPPVTLAAMSYLVVFASGKDRRDPAGWLHTNFKLSGDGEYLALSDPEGAIRWSFGAGYPPQSADISWGMPQEVVETTLVQPGAPARAFIPLDDGLGRTWTAVAFDDSGWLSGPTAVGYDGADEYADVIGLDVGAAMKGRSTSAYIRVPFTLADPSTVDYLTLRTRYDDGWVAYLNGRLVARANAPVGINPLPTWAAVNDHSGPSSGSAQQTFDGGGLPYDLAMNGQAPGPAIVSGGPAGSYVRLLQDNSPNLNNSIGFDRAWQRSDRVVITFDYRMSAEAGYSGERADGFGVALLDLAAFGESGPISALPGAATWERPSILDSFAVGFDIYDGTDTENSVSLHWDGGQAATVRVPSFDLNNGKFNRVRVEVAFGLSESTVTVEITPDILGTPGSTAVPFRDVPIPGMGWFDHRLAFGGRTGGAFVGLDIDTIRVDYSNSAPAYVFEEIDLSRYRSDLVAGQNVLAIHGLNHTADDSTFLILPELVAVNAGDLDPAVVRFFPEPTPGAANGRGYPGVSAPPSISWPSGTFTGTLPVTISPGTAGATIRYTTDRKDPTETSPAYTGQLSFTKSTVLRARSFVPGYYPSDVTERMYLKLDPGVSSFNSDLPLMAMETFGSGIGQDVYTTAACLFLDTVDGRCYLTDTPYHAGAGGLQLRGSSSIGFPKKMYKLETWDRHGDDIDVSLLGLPADSDWVLNGPYSDKSLMRNHLAYAWSNDIGRYAPRTRFFELFLSSDGNTISSADYMGVYVLIEKIKGGPERVDIKRLFPSDDEEPRIQGGYILKKDRLDPGDAGIRTNSGQVLGLVEPKEDEITSTQRAWILAYLNAFESVLYGAGFQDPVNGYAKYIDVDAFIDHHIMVEITKNIDGYRLSTYMYKDRWKKLAMGPIWDYNLSLGNADYLDGWKSDGWYCDLVGDGDYPWYRRLFQDPEFRQRYHDRWTLHRARAFGTDTLLGKVDTTVDFLAESQARNFQKWLILGVELWPNWFVGPTYQSEIDFMKGWIQGRVAWMDPRVPSSAGTIPAPPSIAPSGGAIPAGGLDLDIVGSSGTVYYTLDGTDPRLRGGGVSSTARSLEGGSEVTLIPAVGPVEVRIRVPDATLTGTGWTIPAYFDGGWTGGNGGTGIGYERGNGYEALIDWDIETAMYNVNGSVYARIHFTVADPASLRSLTLRMMYDDGFAAYLNGTLVTSGNAPSPLVWNSADASVRDETAAVTFEDHDLTSFLGQVRQGANILALHGVNAGAGSSDFLLRCELVATRLSSGSDGIRIDEATEVNARTKLGATWSGPVRAVFVADGPVPIRISEVHFHPPAVDPSLDIDREEFEFTALDMKTLAPGAYAVIVRNREAFASRYPGLGSAVAGEYSGHLSNEGELLRLLDGRGQVVQEFTYDDDWYREADGRGQSLHIIDPAGSLGQWNVIQGWKPSVEDGGSPGAAEPPDPAALQLPGDWTQDATLDVSDAIGVLSFLFVGEGDLPCAGELSGSGANVLLLDSNQDGAVDIADPIHVLLYLFAGGPPGALGGGCLPIAGCPDACGGP